MSVFLKMEVRKYAAAVRGFHYYQRFWRPKENEELDCIHEPDNVFDRFAIKTVNKDGDTVGHLPKELSRVTKYFLDRGFTMKCKLTSNHYRRSPLVQGGLEIKCEVMINARPTLLQAKLTTRYLELVHSLYTEPVEEKLMGELIFNFVMTLPPLPGTSITPLEKRKRKKNENGANSSRDIREMFTMALGKKKKNQQQGNCITIE